MTASFCRCLPWIDLSTLTGLPRSSHPHHHIAVEYVEGVGVKTWTCSGRVRSTSEQKRESSSMWDSVQPGWPAIR